MCRSTPQTFFDIMVTSHSTLCTVSNMPLGTIHFNHTYSCRLCGHMLQGQQASAQGSALPFVVLNGAFARDVACVSVPAGVTVQHPVHIVYLSTGEQSGSLPAAMHCILQHVLYMPT